MHRRHLQGRSVVAGLMGSGRPTNCIGDMQMKKALGAALLAATLTAGSASAGPIIQGSQRRPHQSEGRLGEIQCRTIPHWNRRSQSRRRRSGDCRWWMDCMEHSEDGRCHSRSRLRILIKSPAAVFMLDRACALPRPVSLSGSACPLH